MTERRTRKKLPRRPRLQRGLSIIPSVFTVGNMFCGYYALIATVNGDFDHSAIAIGLGAVLDALDGRIARMTKTTSEFGGQLDSLADLLTFGVAPAMLAFTWGLDAIGGIESNTANHVQRLGQLATFAFVICGALRLARFNIQSLKPSDSNSRRYFVGLPIPAAAGLIAAVVHYFKSPILVVGSALLWGILVLTTAFLMISTVRYYSFKELNIKKPGPRIALAATAMLLGLTIFYSEIVLLSLAIVYAASGPIGKLAQMVHRLTTGHVTPSEPVHGNIKT